MNDNLAQLIQNEQVGEQTPATDFESHENEEIVIQETPVIEQSLIRKSINNQKVDVIMLSEWFENNNENLDRVNRLKIQVRGVQPDERLLCSVLDPKGEIDEDSYQRIRKNW